MSNQQCPGRGQARCLTCAHYLMAKKPIPEDITCPFDLEDTQPGIIPADLNEKKDPKLS